MRSDTETSNSTMMDAPSSLIRRSPKRRTPELRAMEAGFVAHEAWAFEAAYTAYRRVLFGAALGVLHDASEAEDCVHDVLLRLWQRGHAYTPARGSLPAFLSVCVRNEALSRRRRGANRARIERARLDEGAVEPAPEGPAVNRVDIANLLQTLSDAQRVSIRMAYYDGLTHEEIANRLSEPVGTVKSRLSNALRVLRRALTQGDTR